LIAGNHTLLAINRTEGLFKVIFCHRSSL